MMQFLRRFIGVLTALALFNMAATGLALAPAGPAHHVPMVEMANGMSCENCLALPSAMAGCAGVSCWISAASPAFVIQPPVAVAVYHADAMFMPSQYESRPPIRPA